MQPWSRHAFVARHTVLFARRTFQANQASTTTLALVQKRPLLYPHQLQLHLCTICTVNGPAALLACCAVLELSSGIWAALDPAAAFTDVCQLQSSELSASSCRLYIAISTLLLYGGSWSLHVSALVTPFGSAAMRVECFKRAPSPVSCVVSSVCLLVVPCSVVQNASCSAASAPDCPAFAPLLLLLHSAHMYRQIYA